MAHSHFISTKCTHITIHGTCLSGLYPVPFTHKSHGCPHFNIYISFGGPKYCITALNTYVIPLLRHILTTQCITLMLILQKNHHQNHLNIKIFYSSTIINKHFDLKYEHYHDVINVKVP
ncbi:BAL_1a_G0038620.mRNA.1.CDS.1 [Saccharomyces cerevisiae]|nr:BAL_1a_G0006300.mRNA.1.CDS.1 [Saccharomyces cerevisiae]CAI4513605.1 BAL_1a_G0027230.mRNA.1.CDS.1 [Saccharomyces cerevisiae]CAI4636379.1 BAL_1a_G0038620.mRNA.1.CDS.1 [Saccharomyces cerevisiae]CAI7058587.1 BAL_1a_G0006300.mRNA.1.CDS.1 [Saccharomyces cerevisiae]CAI7160862.1 BAL_1a_G0027230.mRNA.1.CDS.1 [Saccharomyces cerevisiae]